MLLDATIVFPNLGIEIQELPSGFYIGGFYVAYYGVIIAVAMIVAVVLAMLRARKTNQDSDDYVDIGIFAIIAGVIGARIYYVIFSLDEYDSFVDMLNIRNGGLAIYGGIIAGVIATLCVCKYKKISFLRVLDTIAPGVVLAQAIGRWGNFFNKEAYGGYTDNLFAMRIKYSEANGVITTDILSNRVIEDGATYIQVHPTFLYESAGCLLIFILIVIFRRWQRYNGEIVLWYLGSYALMRIFVEQLRTDQLLIGDIPVSQLLSVIIFAGAFAVLLINRLRLRDWTPDFHLVLEDGEPGTRAYKEARIQARKDKKAAKKGKAEEEPEAAEEDAGAQEQDSEESNAEGEASEETEGGEVLQEYPGDEPQEDTTEEDDPESASGDEEPAQEPSEETDEDTDGAAAKEAESEEDKKA